jgi:dihydroorotate dehydrogenase electron transfer subunit
MEHRRVTVLENRQIAAGYFVLRTTGFAELKGAQPGQFAMLRGEWGTDPLLPRAFSFLRVHENGEPAFLIKRLGRGTARLEVVAPGQHLDLLGPLGRGFSPPIPGGTDLLVAGGVGLAPLLMYAEHHREAATDMALFYGGRTPQDLVLLEELAALGLELHLSTEDGKPAPIGRAAKRLEHMPGRVTAALDPYLLLTQDAASQQRVLACGPDGMLQAVRSLANKHGRACFLSLEGEMACGIGVCLGCAVAAKPKPYLYVCTDGPVLSVEDLA